MADLDLTPEGLEQFSKIPDDSSIPRSKSDREYIKLALDWIEGAQNRLRALAAEKRAAEWQPIETAPRDGRHVILYGHWRQFHGTTHESNHVNSGHYANGWVCEGRYEEYFIASKWRPLPPPPKEPTP